MSYFIIIPLFCFIVFVLIQKPAKVPIVQDWEKIAALAEEASHQPISLK